jgi:hypothetical protein
MAQIGVFAHIPRLRTAVDRTIMGVGELVKITWGSWNQFTAGAFSEWRAAYEATDPVFFCIELDEDLPFVQPGPLDDLRVAELKMRARDWYNLLPGLIGSEFLTAFHDILVDEVWAALMLAAPGAAPGWPRMSCTLLVPSGEHRVVVAGQPALSLRVQGETDQEYLFGPDIAGTSLSDDEVIRAQGA